ncbi:MAG: hypothetical protein HYT94_05160 [Parcubacteria group bacterium]|nr:hypothetical protein [Parcubacteria group bacterium]
MRNQSTYNPPAAEKKIDKKPSRAERGAYLLSYFMISTLIAILSLVVILILLSILTSGTIFGEEVSKKIPIWLAAIITLAAYVLLVLPLKALRYYITPHNSYALYPSHASPKYGDATLWLLFFILLAWYIMDNKDGIGISLQNFPEWWRLFVDTAGAWLYR